jgi:hypothetical protein
MQKQHLTLISLPTDIQTVICEYVSLTDMYAFFLTTPLIKYSVKKSLKLWMRGFLLRRGKDLFCECVAPDLAKVSLVVSSGVSFQSRDELVDHVMIQTEQDHVFSHEMVNRIKTRKLLMCDGSVDNFLDPDVLGDDSNNNWAKYEEGLSNADAVIKCTDFFNSISYSGNIGEEGDYRAVVGVLLLFCAQHPSRALTCRMDTNMPTESIREASTLKSFS